MALNFPLNPTLNDEYTFSNKTWIWNGVGWVVKIQTINGGIDSASITTLIDSNYISQRAATTTIDSASITTLIDSNYISQRAATTAVNTMRTVDTFTGDDSTVTFTLSSVPVSINAITVNYQGVLQLQDAYSIAGNQITFDSAPATGTILNVYIENYASIDPVGNLNYTTLTYTGDDSSVNFDVTQISAVDNILVMENGVVQTPTVDYTVSNGVITFDSAPATGVSIQIRQLPTASVLAQGGLNNPVFFENDAHVTSSYIITSGKNAMSAGPITIDSGITVTIPTGSYWTIV